MVGPGDRRDPARGRGSARRCSRSTRRRSCSPRCSSCRCGAPLLGRPIGRGGAPRDLGRASGSCVREPVLRRLSVAWVVLVLGVGMAMVGDVPLVELFGRGGAAFGVMIGFWGAGSVIGSLAGRWLKPSNEARWLVLGTGLVSVFALAMALSPWFCLVLALNLAWGAAEAVTNVADQNIMQRRSPDSVRSRVFGAQEGIWHGSVRSPTSRRRSCCPWSVRRGCTRSSAVAAVPLGDRDPAHPAPGSARDLARVWRRRRRSCTRRCVPGDPVA